MDKKKIWILNHSAHDIQSVNKISLNLSKLYKKLNHDHFEVLEIPLMDSGKVSSLDSDLKSLLIQFKESPPDHVAIVHGSGIFHPFLCSLLLIKTEKSPQFIFHVVGNFIRHGEAWFALNHLLSNKNIQFVVASSCYQKLLSNFISKENLTIIPFPMNLANNDEAVSVRNLKNDSLKVLYAGRYHKQKNVTPLIQILNEISKETQKKICLNLVVYFDDFNPTTIGAKEILGKQYADYLKAIGALSPFLEVNIFSHKNEEELYRLYREHDVCISFSTFLDEDYGYSIMESLANGTPAIVSLWGGYKDFYHRFPNDCFGLEVTSLEDKFHLNLEKLPKILNLISKRTLENRAKLKQDVEEYVGDEELISQLMKLLIKKSEFLGFEQSLLNFAADLKKVSGKDILLKFKSYYGSFW